MSFEELSRWLDEHADMMVDLQSQLTAVPALNPESGGEGEWEKARLLEAWLRGRGFPEPEHYDTPDERVAEGSRPNFIVRIPGRDRRRTVWVMTHLDVVPPGERLDDGTWAGWDTNPFTMHRDGDRLVGRGVEDNQQALVASTLAGLALLENAVPPAHDVALLYVSAEETGSEYGLKWLLREHPELFGQDDIILVPDGGNEKGSMVEVAEKSVLWLTFHVRGKQAHGSMPQFACNAFRAAARLICRLDAGFRERFDAHEDLFSPPCSSFEPTRHDRNVPNVNTIPGKEDFSFDCRILPRFDLDEVLAYIDEAVAEIDREVGTETSVTVENRLDAPEPTPVDAPVVRMVRSAVREVYEVEGEPMGIGGSTVAAFFRQAGYPVVVWSRCLGLAHQANETCLISNMVGDAKVYAHIFLQEAP